MKIRELSAILLLLLGLSSLSVRSQGCYIENSSFTFGERIDYTIYYHLAGIWVSAGEVFFQVDSSRIGSSDHFHFNSIGTTYEKYDWIYKVRDEYESYTNVNSFQPLRFKRKVNEGSTYIREDYLFNHRKNEVYTIRKMDEEDSYKKDTVQFKGCGYDVLSMIYYARNIDFSGLKEGDKIPIRIFIDNEMHESYIRYLGKEEIKLKDEGRFRCIKFSPLLLEGTIFNAGEDMIVYVTDDENKVPLLIETPILVGSIRARVEKMSGLKHPLNSLIKED